MAKRDIHSQEQISAFAKELENQSYRGAALIAAAVLDEILEMLLSRRLIDVGSDRHDALFGRGKPLDAFSAKIELGYALGRYGNKARIQLETIRDVRNRFAHRIEPLKFTDPKIVEAIKSRALPSVPKTMSVREQFLSTFRLIFELGRFARPMKSCSRR